MGDNYGLLLNRSKRQRYRRRKIECIEAEVSEETLRRWIMEFKITGTPEEIEKLLNAIGGSKEQLGKASLKKILNFSPYSYDYQKDVFHRHSSGED